MSENQKKLLTALAQNAAQSGAFVHYLANVCDLVNKEY